MLKRILFPLDGGADSAAAGHQVIDIARRHGAFVTAMAVVDRPGIDRALKPMGIGVSHLARDARAWLLRQNEREAEIALATFARRLGAAGVANVETEEFAGPVDAIVAESRFFDVVVMGVRALDSLQKEDPSATLQEVVKRSVAPVLAVAGPELHPGSREVKHVAVCFDGSPQAARALQAYARLAPYGTAVATTVLTVSEREGDDEGSVLLDRAANFLLAHGHSPFVKHLAGKARDEIVSFVAENGVDLLVMGAYGRSGLRALFFGSLTEHLIRRTDVALFISA
jgi:nucleotide-binding universal stress UspA family protein